MCNDLKKDEDYCKLGKFEAFHEELRAGKSTSEICEQEQLGDQTCELAKKARKFDKKQETKKSFYKEMDDVRFKILTQNIH